MSTENPHVGSDVLTALEESIPDTPEVRRAGKEEALRLMLTDVMRAVRKKQGLSQAEVGERLGTGQSWVSKLESANHDHQVESVASYLDALGAELRLAVRTGDGVIHPVNYKRLLDGRRYDPQGKPRPTTTDDARYAEATAAPAANDYGYAMTA